MKVYQVLKKFQVNGWVYAPKGRCECPEDCSDVDNPCTRETATACTCNDAGYCGMKSNVGACGIEPWQYGGDLIAVEDNDHLIPYFKGRGCIGSMAIEHDLEALKTNNPLFVQTLFSVPINPEWPIDAEITGDPDGVPESMPEGVLVE